MTGSPYFESPRNWKAARALLTFRPVEPKHTAGFRLQSIRIFVRDHKLRELPVEDRTLEAHYGGFSLCQSRRGAAEARRLALDVSYGRVGASSANLRARTGTGARRYRRAQPLGRSVARRGNVLPGCESRNVVRQAGQNRPIAIPVRAKMVRAEDRAALKSRRENVTREGNIQRRSHRSKQSRGVIGWHSDVTAYPRDSRRGPPLQIPACNRTARKSGSPAALIFAAARSIS
jgi:hypothetical protein